MQKKESRPVTANELHTGPLPDRYEYPDKGDRITRSFIARSEPYPGYWEQSEDSAFAGFYAFCKETRREAMLDVGAGEGRLALKLSPYFREVTALDPDHGRLAQAQSAALEHGVPNIRFLEEEFLTLEMPGESFDVVMISHVIQHINICTVPNFFSKAHQLLKRRGKLIITTSHAKQGNGTAFSKAVLNGDRSSEVPIDEKEFNRLVVNSVGVLPVRFFSFGALRDMLSSLFDIETERVFHELYPRNIFDLVMFRDTLINLSCIRDFFGRDMLVEARKR